MLKPKTESNTLRFKLNETIDGIKEKIAQEMLPLVELEWTQKPDGNSRFFEAKLDDIKFVVRENSVEFVRENAQTQEGLMTESQTVEQTGGDGKKFKSLLYGRLCERFDKNNEMVFFTDVLKTLIEHSGEEDATPGEIENEGPIYLRENQE